MRREADAEKAKRWRGLIGQAARSRMSIRAFCAAQGVSEGQFYGWQRKLRIGRGHGRRRQAPDRGSAASFALVSTDGEGLPEVGIELVLAGGRRLRIGRGVDAETLQRVVAVLEGARC